MATPPSGWKSLYRVVRRIPPGRVATYGQIAALAGMPRAARQVGWALHALREEDDVPWQRVINARGEISGRGIREIEGFQRALLESEGVEFNPNGRVDLTRFGWQPRSARSGKTSVAPKEEKATQAKKSSGRARPGAKSPNAKNA